MHPPEEGIAAVNATMPDTVQIVYSLARRHAEHTFLATARTANVGVIARETLANGFLAGRYGADSEWEQGDIRSRMPRPYVAQLALRFVLDRPEVSCAIVGTNTVQQVEENPNAGT